MAGLIDKEKFQDAMIGLSEYFYSKKYSSPEIVALCTQIVFLKTAEFSINTNEEILKQK